MNGTNQCNGWAEALQVRYSLPFHVSGTDFFGSNAIGSDNYQKSLLWE
jgi:hypothetical protein